MPDSSPPLGHHETVTGTSVVTHRLTGKGKDAMGSIPPMQEGSYCLSMANLDARARGLDANARFWFSKGRSGTSHDQCSQPLPVRSR